MSSLGESEEVFVSDNMLKKFSYLIKDHGPMVAAGIILGDNHVIDETYMKEQAIQYYIQGPAWRHDDYLLERAWLKGYVGACRLAGKSNKKLRFTIDAYCISKLQAPLPEDSE